MFYEVSTKYLKRSSKRSILLALLTLLTTVFVILGVSMFMNSQKLLEQADETYTTLAMLECTSGYYPDETHFDKTTVESLKKLDLNRILSDEDVITVHDYQVILGCNEKQELNRNFNLPYYYRSIITFKVMYETQDGNYRCVLCDSYYGGKMAEGTMFGLSKEALSKNKDLKLEKDHIYLAHGDFRMEEQLRIFSPYEDCGIHGKNNPVEKMREFPIVDITDRMNYIETDDDKQYLEQIVDYYKVQQCSFKIGLTDQLMKHEDFYLGSIVIEEGRAWTEEEAANKKPVIVINRRLATVSELSVGDTIELGLHYSSDQTDFYNSYNPQEGFSQKETFTVIGIYNDRYVDTGVSAYIPDTVVKDKIDQIQYYIAGIEVKNGAGAEYLSRMESILPDGYRMNVYDEGYEQTVEPIYAMRFNSIIILILCFASALIVLFLFGTLFVMKQQETISVMTALGTKKRDMMRYLLSGAAIISLLGTLLGFVISLLLGKSVITYVYERTQQGRTFDNRYSILAMGMQKVFEGKIQISLAGAAVTALLLFTLTIIMCYIFSRTLIKQCAIFGGKENKKKTKTSQEKKVSTKKVKKVHFNYATPIGEIKFTAIERGKFVLRHAVRSIFRNRKMSGFMVILPSMITIFMTLFTQTISYYERSLNQAYDKFNVSAYYTNVSGEYLKATQVPEYMQEEVVNSGFVDKQYHSLEYKTEYVDVVKGEPGTKKFEESLHSVMETYEEVTKMPQTSFALERKVYHIFMMDDMIWTDDMNHTREFYMSAPPIMKYLDGYEKVFESCDADKEEYEVAFVTEEFLKKHNLRLGDHILLANYYIYTQDKRETYEAFHKVVKIVGTYVSTMKKNNIYVPCLDFSRLRTSTFVNYDLKNTRQLSKFRDNLEKIQITRVGYLGDTRVCMVINDKELIQAVSSYQNTINFMNTLRYVLFILIFIIGFVASYLSMRIRRQEMAIIRSLGSGTIKTFFLFFVEQSVTALTGTLVGLLVVIFLLKTITMVQLITVCLFAVVFLLGSGICIARMNRKNVLSILLVAE